CEHVEQCISIQSPISPNDTVYIAWNAHDINSYRGATIFAKSTDGGKTLGYYNITDSTGITASPVIAVGPNGTVYLAGTRSGFPEGSHALFAKSTDGGNSFAKGIDLDLLPEQSVPEFPLAIPILLVGITSLIVFTRMRK
ncbi:MAG: exo-alpha-sialidase, partial [Thaumarchaeota archaeon]|nr:exo-alpha-sialidase [Nitrososphaerota archaeon]